MAEDRYASEKSTGFRGSKLTTPRIVLEEKIPKTFISEKYSASETAAAPSDPQDLQVATPHIENDEKSKTSFAEDSIKLDKGAKSTGLRGSKIPIPRITFEEENPKTSLSEDPTKSNKASKSTAFRASNALRITLDHSQEASFNNMVTSTPVHQKLSVGLRASIQSQKIAINSSIRYVSFHYSLYCFQKEFS